MDPTTKEFLSTLANIKEELTHLKSEQYQLKLHISKVFEENKRLISELKENAELRFLHLSENEVGQLEQKLQAAIASKNAAVEMWQLTLQQSEKQEKLLLGKESFVATERSELEKQFLQIKEEYAKGLSVLSKELSDSRSELSKLKQELGTKNLEFDQCRIDLNSTEKELEFCKKTVTDLSDANSKLAGKNLSIQSSLSESDKSLTIFKKEISDLTVKNADLLAAVSKLQEENKKLKSEILGFEKDAKDSLLAAEEAILQKKEMICKEKQYKNEIEMLKSSVDVQIEKISMIFKAEIKDIKKKSTERIQDLISEIDLLHKQIGEKQNLFERANREKQALKSKFELLFSENSNGMSVSNSTFDDMCKRLTMAEKAKGELELKVSSLEISLQEIKSAKDQEIQYHLEKQHSLNERLKTLSGDFNQVSSDRVKISNETAKLKKKLADLEKEIAKMRTEYANNTSALELESHRKRQVLQEQVQYTEEHYKNICSELQKLLETEFRISNKLKAEFEDFISQSETALRELNQENVQLKNGNIELINILHQSNLRVPSDILLSLS